MTKRQLVFIRPRRGSALEKFQAERRAELPDLVHSWAESFKTMLEKSERETDA